MSKQIRSVINGLEIARELETRLGQDEIIITSLTTKQSGTQHTATSIYELIGKDVLYSVRDGKSALVGQTLILQEMRLETKEEEETMVIKLISNET